MYRSPKWWSITGNDSISKNIVFVLFLIRNSDDGLTSASSEGFEDDEDDTHSGEQDSNDGVIYDDYAGVDEDETGSVQVHDDVEQVPLVLDTKQRFLRLTGSTNSFMSNSPTGSVVINFSPELDREYKVLNMTSPLSDASGAGSGSGGGGGSASNSKSSTPQSRSDFGSAELQTPARYAGARDSYVRVRIAVLLLLFLLSFVCLFVCLFVLFCRMLPYFVGFLVLFVYVMCFFA